MSVRFQDVSFRYPGSEAGVLHIDLELGPGELVAVIGASGSGKTTLLNLLAGFLRPDSGRIVINGKDVTDLPPKKRDLGQVFQSYALFQHMSAWRNVAYPLKVRGVPREKRRALAIEALKNVDLEAFEDRLPSTMSGGQQQRVALARALVFKPKALLLDEPLSALDASLRMSMRDEIQRVQQQAGIATLHVTHDQEEALSIAHRVAVMEQGKLAQVATPRELYDSPATTSVARFVGHANLWEGEVAAQGCVRCEVGLLSCRTAGRLIGERVVVLVRPEKILPLGANQGAPNQVRGALVRDRFLGPVRRYDLRVGQEIVQGETDFWGGIESVSIPPEAIRLLST